MKRNAQIRQHAIKIFFIFLLSMAAFLNSNAQTISSSTLITPVCNKGTGSIQLSFTGATYPFTLYWYGGGIDYGSVVITASPQTITIQGSPSNIDYPFDGVRANFYILNPGFVSLGQYKLGINFDPATVTTATCTTPAVITVNNIAGGTAPYTLELLDKTTSTVLVSGSSPLSVSSSIACGASNAFSLHVKDANGCYVANDTFYVPCNGLQIASTSTIASCTNGTATINSVSGGVSPYTYLWSNGATTSSISGLIKGGYSCMVSDINGCKGTTYVNVQQNPGISLMINSIPATCKNADGQSQAFASGGTAPYTYLWDNGATTQKVTNFSVGSYKVTTTDANSCIGEGYVYINATTPVNVTYTQTASSCTSATGSITLSATGGQTPYTYQWDGLTATTATVNNLAPGNYGFLVTDANNCERKGTAVVNSISQPTGSITTQDPICPATLGNITTSFTSSAMPLTYLWSNGATTQNISNVAVGSYSCVIKDANSCEVKKSAYIGSRSPLQLGFSTTNASCIFTADGTATVNVYGGTAPYTYQWYHGATSATISNLKTGKYWVTVTDANGCQSTAYNNFVNVGYNSSNACYCIIEGTVYDDINANCTQNSGELGLSDILISIPGVGSTTTNANGYYSFKVPVGNYTVIENLVSGVGLASCQTNNQAVAIATVGGGCVNTVNFANTVTPLHDIHIYSVNRNAPIPGNDYREQLIVKNRGTVTENAIQVGYKSDGQLTWNTIANAALTNIGTNHYELTSPLSLARNKETKFELNHYTPTSTPINTVVYLIDSAAYQAPVVDYWITNEETPWNNINTKFTTVLSSYDPNNKEVYPKGEGKEGKIALTDKDFRYVINFENNGTARAQKVVLIDTLDTDLDLSTFRTLGSSHTMVARIDDGGVLTITFDNINLDFTPLNVFKASAQGYASYTISAKTAAIKIGTVITNRADIYFDYNAPVATNTTTNTYARVSGVKSIEDKIGSQLVIYPNPTTGFVNFAFADAIEGQKVVEIYNTQGQKITEKTMLKNEKSIDLSYLPANLYLVKITLQNGEVQFGKFVKN